MKVEVSKKLDEDKKAMRFVEGTAIAYVPAHGIDEEICNAVLVSAYERLMNKSVGGMDVIEEVLSEEMEDEGLDNEDIGVWKYMLFELLEMMDERGTLVWMLTK